MTAVPTLQQEPICPKCGSDSITFRELCGPVAVTNARSDIIRHAEETAHRQQEEAERQRKVVVDQARSEKARLGEWLKSQLDATTIWSRAEVEAVDQEYQQELNRIEMHFRKVRNRPEDPDDPTNVLLGSPEEEKKDALLAAERRRTNLRNEVGCEAEEKRRTLKVEEERRLEGVKTTARQRLSDIERWLKERQNTVIEAALGEADSKHPLESNNRLYLVYCSACGHVVAATCQPGNVAETLGQIRDIIFLIQQTMVAYIKAMSEAATSQSRAQLLQAGLQLLDG